jgi:hypothetical protein
MKTIKIIDLVNKIVNDEEVPKKIKYQENIFIYDKERKDYIHKIDEDGWQSETILFNIMCTHFIRELLENEVEIIEEDKEIEKLEFYEYEDESSKPRIRTHKNTINNMRIIDVTLALKINELVDEVNKLKESNNGFI